jgi:hypothetical protein
LIQALVAERPIALPPALRKRERIMLDLNAMLRKAQYCAERAETSVHHDMRVHWRDAADAWFYAAEAIHRNSRIIDEFELNHSRKRLGDL